MNPGKVFTGSAKFQGIVNVNDFRFPRRLQELLQALFHFLRRFLLDMGMIESIDSHVRLRKRAVLLMCGCTQIWCSA